MGDPLRDSPSSDHDESVAEIFAVAALLNAPEWLTEETIEVGLDVKAATARIKRWHAHHNRPVGRQSGDFWDPLRCEFLPCALTESRRQELANLTAVSETAQAAVVNAETIFRSVNTLHPRWTSFTIRQLCKRWKKAYVPLVELALLEPFRQSYWETLIEVREARFGAKDRLIGWQDGHGNLQHSEHWHHAVVDLAHHVATAISESVDGQDLLNRLLDKRVLESRTVGEICSELKRESEEALKEIGASHMHKPSPKRPAGRPKGPKFDPVLDRRIFEAWKKGHGEYNSLRDVATAFDKSHEFVQHAIDRHASRVRKEKAERK